MIHNLLMSDSQLPLYQGVKTPSKAQSCLGLFVSYYECQSKNRHTLLTTFQNWFNRTIKASDHF